MLARLRANQLLEQSGLEALLVCTIHDSIVADTQARNVEAVGRLLKQSVEEVPKLVKQTWDYDFKLPLTAEVQYGMNKADMQELRL
jgi:DNA polymerase I-like protein with 3'-5' exonuclease and polymerase domains